MHTIKINYSLNGLQIHKTVSKCRRIANPSELGGSLISYTMQCNFRLKILAIVILCSVFLGYKPKNKSSVSVFYLSCHSTADKILTKEDVFSSPLVKKEEYTERKSVEKFQLELNQIVSNNKNAISDKDIDARIVIIWNNGKKKNELVLDDNANYLFEERSYAYTKEIRQVISRNVPVLNCW